MMKAHEFENKPIKVVVFNGPNRFENYCRCGYRAHGLDLIAVSLHEESHLRNAVGFSGWMDRYMRDKNG